MAPRPPRARSGEPPRVITSPSFRSTNRPGPLPVSEMKRDRAEVGRTALPTSRFFWKEAGPASDGPFDYRGLLCKRWYGSGQLKGLRPPAQHTAAGPLPAAPKRHYQGLHFVVDCKQRLFKSKTIRLLFGCWFFLVDQSGAVFFFALKIIAQSPVQDTAPDMLKWQKEDSLSEWFPFDQGQLSLPHSARQ